MTAQVIVQSRLCDEPGRRTDLQGERRLALAVLQDAVEIYSKGGHGGRRNRRLFAEAEQWIQSPERGWAFSFERICETLELDPEFIRRALWANLLAKELRESSTSGP